MSFMSDPSSSAGRNTAQPSVHLEPLSIPPNEGSSVQPNSFTEQELGEYKEQDRYLPVRLAALVAHPEVRAERLKLLFFFPTPDC